MVNGMSQPHGSINYLYVGSIKRLFHVKSQPKQTHFVLIALYKTANSSQIENILFDLFIFFHKTWTYNSN